MSMARRVLPWRLALKRPDGSESAAPLAKVIFTTSLYVSPVQIIPSCDHTGTPPGFEGFRHFTSSTTSGSACLMSVRIRASVSPRQSLGSLIRALFFTGAVAFFMVVVAPPADSGTRSEHLLARQLRCLPNPTGDELL